MVEMMAAICRGVTSISCAVVSQVADATFLGWRGRIAARRLTRDIQSRLLSQAELARVLGETTEAQHLSQLVEENVIRARQGVGKVHVRPPAHIELGRGRDDVFLQRG